MDVDRMIKLAVPALLTGLIALSGCADKQTRLLRQEMTLKNVTRHNGISSTLELDRVRLSAGPGESLQVTLTIKNEGSDPVHFTFSSSQEYDFSVVDSSGREYWRWSEGRFFAMVVLRKALDEEGWVYQEEVPTVDRNGQPFRPGQYVLRARLVSDRSIQNQMSFEIE